MSLIPIIRMLCIPAFFAVVITAVSDFDRGNANSVLFNPQNHSLPFLKKGCTAGSTVMQAFDTDTIILCTIIGEGDGTSTPFQRVSRSRYPLLLTYMCMVSFDEWRAFFYVVSTPQRRVPSITSKLPSCLSQKKQRVGRCIFLWHKWLDIYGGGSWPYT